MRGRCVERGVERGIAAGAVGADRDQIRLLVQRRERGAHALPGAHDLLGDDLADQARDALQYVDRGIVAGVRQRAREHDVAVEDRAHRVGDRLVHVVAVDEHGVETGDRAPRRSCRRARAGAAAARTRDGV